MTSLFIFKKKYVLVNRLDLINPILYCLKMNYSHILSYFSRETNETLIYTCFLILFSFLLYYFIRAIINKLSWSYEKKLKNLTTIRNILVFSVVFVSLIMFGGHLKTFVYSAAAIFSAFLILFRELILSIVGFLVSNRTYYVGDYISYDNNKGLIMDKTPFNTKLWLIDTYNNEVITIPNFNYLNQKIIKYPKYGKYISYTIIFSVDSSSDIVNTVNNFKSTVLSINNETIETKNEYFIEKLKQGKIKELPNLTPIFGYDFSDSKNYKVLSTLIVHPSDVLILKDRILENFISKIKS